MAADFKYEDQLKETCRLVAEAVGHENWQLVYQSRSGPPSQPWLEPDILTHLETLSTQGQKDVIVLPVGFVSDHMEVKFDLDTEALQLAESLGLNMIRAAAVGVHPAFVTAIRELVLERLAGAERKAVGLFPPSPDGCPDECLSAACARQKETLSRTARS
jgi:ferrochelatase